MAKINLTKAEETLAATLQKILVEHLLLRADSAQGKDIASRMDAYTRNQLIHSLQLGLKHLHRSDKKIYQKLELPKKQLTEMLKSPENLSEEQWKQLVALKAKVDSLLQAMPEATKSNEEIVKSERRKHIYKRFNVNEKWLPLK